MKKAIGMFVALILALGMSGLAYAHWSKILYIEGSVETGYVDAEWSAGLSWDTEPDEKDYSYIDCWVDELDYQLLHVEVVDAYPCIDYYQIFDIHNCGTIPLHINSIVVDEDPETAGVQDIPEITVEVTLRGWFPLAIVGQPQMVLPVQLEPCDTVYGLIHVHVEQDYAEPDTLYEFEVEVICDQWNYTPPG